MRTRKINGEQRPCEYVIATFAWGHARCDMPSDRETEEEFDNGSDLKRRAVCPDHGGY